MARRILIVEDHAPFRRVICAALQRRAEFETSEAADGLEGLRKIEDLQPDVILLDINLPGLDGFAIAQQIPKLAPYARLLFMSQESAPDVVQEALSLGAQGYIHKTSAGTDLLPAIDAVLAGRRFVSRSLAFPTAADPAAARRHEILFCADDTAIVEGILHFIAPALNAGDGAVAVVTKARRAVLLQRLRARGVAIDHAIERGTYLSLDVDVAPTATELVQAIDSVRAAAARAGKAHPRVAACGERAAQMWAAGRTREASQAEALCNELPQDVDILCTYPAPYTPEDQALADICAAHTAVSVC
jgi:two-component system nitrate/nitrite response regulator NarL